MSIRRKAPKAPTLRNFFKPGVDRLIIYKDGIITNGHWIRLRTMPGAADMTESLCRQFFPGSSFSDHKNTPAPIASILPQNTNTRYERTSWLYGSTASLGRVFKNDSGPGLVVVKEEYVKRFCLTVLYGEDNGMTPLMDARDVKDASVIVMPVRTNETELPNLDAK